MSGPAPTRNNDLRPRLFTGDEPTMDRRDFLKQGAVAALAAAASSTGPFVHADDKTGGKNPIIGEGEHRYECHHDWGQAAQLIHWSRPTASADRQDRVHLHQAPAGGEKPKSADAAQDTIVVFDPRASSSARSARSTTAAATASTSARRAARSSSTSRA